MAKRKRRIKLPAGTLRVYLEDDCPRIGCGWRLVTAKVGRKWTYLECVSTCTRGRMRKTAWDVVARSAVSLA